MSTYRVTTFQIRNPQPLTTNPITVIDNNLVRLGDSPVQYVSKPPSLTRNRHRRNQSGFDDGNQLVVQRSGDGAMARVQREVVVSGMDRACIH